MSEIPNPHEIVNRDREFAEQMRQCNLLHWYKDELTEEQTERLNKIYQTLGEMVFENGYPEGKR